MNDQKTDSTAEIEAMSKVAMALSGLEPDAIRRILSWAVQRYDFGAPNLGVNQKAWSGAPTGVGNTPNQSFSELGELYAQTSPRTDAEKALVVAYWHQKVLGEQDFDTQTINGELKHLGYGVTNITRAFDTLRDSKPSLAIQVKKGGSSKQARKRMKITLEGLRTVERMLNRSGNDDE